jgi:hypothetical protein
MNRRGFLASLLGLAAVPLAALLPLRKAQGLVGWRVITREVVLNDDWSIKLTPEQKISTYPDISPRLAERELLAGAGAKKLWYDKSTRTIKFRRYTPWEIYKAPGTSS